MDGELGYIYTTFFPPLWEDSQRNRRVVVGDSPPSREEAFVAAVRFIRIENVLLGQKVQTLHATKLIAKEMLQALPKDKTSKEGRV